MKHIMAICAGIVFLSSYTYMHAHDSYLVRSLAHVATYPVFEQPEKELLAAIPEFFTHACVKQLYFGDVEQRALKPFVETTPVIIESFKTIKEKIAQLREQIATKEEKDMIDLVHYLVNMLLECTATDCSSNPSATRATAADIAEACRELILELLDLVEEINTNVNSIIGNISAPCT